MTQIYLYNEEALTGVQLDLSKSRCSGLILVYLDLRSKYEISSSIIRRMLPAVLVREPRWSSTRLCYFIISVIGSKFKLKENLNLQFKEKKQTS